MYRKKIISLTVIMVLIITVPVLAQEGTADGNDNESNVAAVVNGEEITIEEVDRFANTQQVIMSLYRANQEFTQLILQTEEGQDLIRVFQRRKLEDLVTRKLLEEEAKEREITVSKEDQDQLFEDYIERIKNQNNMDDEQLLNALQQQGIESLEQYKQMFVENTQESLLIDKLRQQVLANVSVKEEELKNYYDSNQEQFEREEEVEASHILFSTENKSEEEARTEAEEVLSQLQDGSNFAELAREYSDGPSAGDGGSLGFIGKGEMVPGFEDTAFNLEVGEISEPVKTEYGYHIIKVTDRKEAGTIPFAEAKEDIRSSLLNKRENEAWQQFIRKLRDEAEIQIKL